MTRDYEERRFCVINLRYLSHVGQFSNNISFLSLEQHNFEFAPRAIDGCVGPIRWLFGNFLIQTGSASYDSLVKHIVRRNDSYNK
jgi:hypothetical protein